MVNYIIQKSVKAKNINEAIKLENKGKITNVFEADEQKTSKKPSAIGFHYTPQDEE